MRAVAKLQAGMIVWLDPGDAVSLPDDTTFYVGDAIEAAQQPDAAPSDARTLTDEECPDCSTGRLYSDGKCDRCEHGPCPVCHESRGGDLDADGVCDTCNYGEEDACPDCEDGILDEDGECDNCDHGHDTSDEDPEPETAYGDIREALTHVREHYPEVVTVTYEGGGAWVYHDAAGDAPYFDTKVLMELIQKGVDEAENDYNTFPVKFEL